MHTRTKLRHFAIAGIVFCAGGKAQCVRDDSRLVVPRAVFGGRRIAGSVLRLDRSLNDIRRCGGRVAAPIRCGESNASIPIMTRETVFDANVVPVGSDKAIPNDRLSDDAARWNLSMLNALRAAAVICPRRGRLTILICDSGFALHRRRELGNKLALHTRKPFSCHVAALHRSHTVH